MLKINFFLFKYFQKIYYKFIKSRVFPRQIIKAITGRYDYNNILSYNKIFLYFSNENQSYIHSKLQNSIKIYEFGCGSGWTGAELLIAAKNNNVKVSEYYGFDSFKGLPNISAKEKKRWTTGSFKYSKEKTIKNLKSANSIGTKIKIITSNFKDVNEIKIDNEASWLIHIDCDLYESTIEALRICQNIIFQGGGVIAFDDYYSGLLHNIDGEKKAFQDYFKDSELDIIWWCNYSQNGAMFIIPKRL